MSCAECFFPSYPAAYAHERREFALAITGIAAVVILVGLCLFWTQRNTRLLAKRDWWSTLVCVLYTILSLETAYREYFGEAAMPCPVFFIENYIQAALIPSVILARCVGLYARHLRQSWHTRSDIRESRVAPSAAPVDDQATPLTLSSGPARRWVDAVLLRYRMDSSSTLRKIVLWWSLPWVLYYIIRLATSPELRSAAVGCRFNDVDSALAIIEGVIAMCLLLPVLSGLWYRPDALFLRTEIFVQLVAWALLIGWFLYGAASATFDLDVVNSAYAILCGNIATLFASVWLPAIVSIVQGNDSVPPALRAKLDEAHPESGLATETLIADLAHTQTEHFPGEGLALHDCAQPAHTRASPLNAVGLDNCVLRSEGSDLPDHGDCAVVAAAVKPLGAELPNPGNRSRDYSACESNDAPADPSALLVPGQVLCDGGDGSSVLPGSLEQGQFAFEGRASLHSLASTINASDTPKPRGGVGYGFSPAASALGPALPSRKHLALLFAPHLFDPAPTMDEITAVLRQPAQSILVDIRALRVFAGLLVVCESGRAVLQEALMREFSAELLGFILACADLREVARRAVSHPRAGIGSAHRLAEGDGLRRPTAVSRRSEGWDAFVAAYSRLLVKYIVPDAPSQVNLSAALVRALDSAAAALALRRIAGAPAAPAADGGGEAAWAAAVRAVCAAEREVFHLIVGGPVYRLVRTPAAFSAAASALSQALPVGLRPEGAAASARAAAPGALRPELPGTGTNVTPPLAAAAARASVASRSTPGADCQADPPHLVGGHAAP